METINAEYVRHAFHYLYPNELPALQSLARSLPDSPVVVNIGRSQDFARTWTLPVDMVFIDGDHSFEGCRGDILGWVPHVKPGGIVAVHDYDKGAILVHDDGPHPVVWGTVDAVVDDLLVSKYKKILHVDSLIAFRIQN